MPFSHFCHKYKSIEFKGLSENSTIPIIGYNPRSENLTTAALKEREYDQNGWPYAQCSTTFIILTLASFTVPPTRWVQFIQS